LNGSLVDPPRFPGVKLNDLAMLAESLFTGCWDSGAIFSDASGAILERFFCLDLPLTAVLPSFSHLDCFARRPALLTANRYSRLLNQRRVRVAEIKQNDSSAAILLAFTSN